MSCCATHSGELHAVDDVTLGIEEGTTLGVVGESGCGKSTLGRTILRMHEPTSGEIIYKGEVINDKSKRELKLLRRDMQMIFQDPYESIDPRMNISTIISEPLICHHIYSDKKQMEAKVEELMDTVGIAPRLASSFPHELDGGRRQRVGIARALALDPQFIVCDEPVSALDVSIQAQVLNLLQDLQEQKKLTYMFITHNLSVVRHIAARICVMYLGQVVELCEKKELFENTLHPYTHPQHHQPPGAHHPRGRADLAHQPQARLPLRVPLPFRKEGMLCRNAGAARRGERALRCLPQGGRVLIYKSTTLAKI